LELSYDKVVKLWKSFNIQSADDLDNALYNFRILFAYHSGKIENDIITYHDTREIFEKGQVLNYTGDPRALFEQQNQKMCYGFLKEKIVRKEALTLPLVLDTHEVLTAGTYDEKRFIAKGERPGSLKKHDYVTGLHEVGYPPVLVKDALEDLLDEISTSEAAKDPLLTAAYFHARFEYIHPFADGNGRVGRTLMNYYLMIKDCPPLIIFDENKKEYYTALEQYDSDEEIQPLKDFFITQTVKTWQRTVEGREGFFPSNKKRISSLHEGRD
jgi:Fic family protein